MSLSTQDVDYLRGIVQENSGNVISPHQVYMLEKQLLPLAETEGMESVEQLVNKLRKHQKNTSLQDKVAEAVTVNETSFFRDVHPFETLKSEILPSIIKRNHKEKQIRIWCAASSSGQEPYSIAMVIQEYFAELRNWRIKILATDLSDEMLEKTRLGKYSQLEVNRGLPIKKLVRFFDRQGINWIAKPELRKLIECRRLNLAAQWPYIGNFDLIFIRNVLIYFDQTVKRDILHRASKLLRPDGRIFIGASEMIIGLDIPLSQEKINKTTCYRSSNI